jgi:hypothetical protein
MLWAMRTGRRRDGAAAAERRGLGSSSREARSNSGAIVTNAGNSQLQEALDAVPTRLGERRSRLCSEIDSDDGLDDFSVFLSSAMRYDSTMVDRQVGRNAELFAQSIADLAPREERYPYLRILVSLIDQAHPEWRQAPNKAERVAELACELSDDQLDIGEVKEVIRVRDKEKGYR